MAYGGNRYFEDDVEYCVNDESYETYSYKEVEEEEEVTEVTRKLGRSLKFDESENVGDGKYYATKNKRGILVLLNNKVDREGHEMDTRRLKSFFKGTLNFDIMDAYDEAGFTFTKNDIDTFLKYVESTLRKKPDKYYCIVFFIGSHGNEDGFQTSDERLYTVEKIKRKFKNDRCEAMAGRPKIILTQICRGRKYEKTVYQADSASSASSEATKSSVTEDSDILVFNATTYGKLSFRSRKKGSTLIRKCLDVFESQWETCHLEEMLLTVRREIIRWSGKDEYGNECKQTAEVKTTLTKRLKLTGKNK